MEIREIAMSLEFKVNDSIKVYAVFYTNRQ